MIAADELKRAKDLQVPRLNFVHIRKVHTLETEAHYYFFTKTSLSCLLS